ncbi:hypothetical protein [Bradyrhizobium japonicum]|uniref:hypothetical protein n=1 Tax=Bradyrhizobium japonicum TaxID=375 RepID=UPI002714B805|nr:hypothetical protein [Bradyrhizobium japonicum]WLB15017.1 hypothetical protein QIH95_23385 [Bradyrhizobium japonicum]
MIRDAAELPLLDSADAVIEALGGRMAVADLTGRLPQQVTNWRAAGTFAPTTFLVMTTALDAIGVRAAPRLWRMDEPAERA